MNKLTLLSDLELERLRQPGVSDETLVRRLAAQTVQKLELTPPVDALLVASYRGIDRVEEVEQPWAGSLTHVGNQTVARVRVSDSRRRRRFTTFHEVEHTYLPGFALTQYRCNTSPKQASQSRSPLEQLADIGASELLFPRDRFLADLGGARPDLEVIEDLADEYDASYEATAMRLVDLAPMDALLLSLGPATKPTQPDAEPRLRVQWSRPSGRWPYIPRHKSVPIDGPLDRSLQGELIDEVGIALDLPSHDLHDVYISARLQPYARADGTEFVRVLALLTRLGTRTKRGGHHAA